MYDELALAGIETLYDDRNIPPGEKLFEADFLGMPWRGVLSERTRKEGKVELKRRGEEEGELVTLKECIKKIKDKRKKTKD